MRLSHIAFLAVITVSAATFLQAQAQNEAQEWVPQGIQALGQNASSRTEFTLDHSMLVLASKLDQEDDSLRRVIAGVNGVSVHIFHFPRGGSYDSGALHDLGEQYHAAGWQHLVNKREKEGGAGATDLWIHFENATVRDIAVVFAKENQLSFVTASGSISPIDLLRLGGHFGIPKMEGGVLVRAPDSARR